MWSCCCSGLPLQANHAEQAASRVGRLRSRMSGATSESTRPSLGVHLLGGGSSGQVWLPVYLKIHTWLTLDKSIARFLRFKWLHVTSCRHFKTSGHEAIKVEKLFTGSLSHVKPVIVVMPLCVSTLKHVVACCCCCCCRDVVFVAGLTRSVTSLNVEFLTVKRKLSGMSTVLR